MQPGSIDRDPHHAKRGFVRPIARSRTLRKVALMALAVGAYSALPLWPRISQYQGVVDIPAELHTMLTLVLGCLLVFRTNTAYSRWWDARVKWGDLVSVVRNLSSKLAFMVRIPENELDEAERILIAFPFALRDHLRDGLQVNDLPGFEEDETQTDHVPSHLVGRLYNAMGKWKARGWIDGAELRVIDYDLRQLMEIVGRCESIRLTRVASSYRVFTRQCVLLFLITLPWGISRDFGWWTPPLAAIVAYFMLGLEVVAEHVEEPFGEDEDDLDLDRLCVAIESSITGLFNRSREARSDAVEAREPAKESDST
jgi:putative membrane protein